MEITAAKRLKKPKDLIKEITEIIGLTVIGGVIQYAVIYFGVHNANAASGSMRGYKRTCWQGWQGKPE